MTTTSPASWERRDHVSTPWRSLGLDELDERVYRSLLEAPSATPRLAQITHRPLTAVRSALRRLRKAGLVTVDADTRLFCASPPENAVGMLIAKVQADLAAARVGATAMQREYDASQAQSGTAELVEVITGQDRIVERFNQLLAGVQSEIMAFVTPPFLAPGDYEDNERNQLQSGVSYRVIYDPDGVEAQGGATELAESVDAGEQARVTPTIPVKMFIVDRRSAIVPLSLESGPAAVVVSRFGLVDALVALFELVWHSAWPLADYVAGAGAQPFTARDRRLIGLMRAGHTDEAIARSLGVTVRTVSRRLALLMQSTGAATRFQLGWRLAELGLDREAGPPG